MLTTQKSESLDAPEVTTITTAAATTTTTTTTILSNNNVDSSNDSPILITRSSSGFHLTSSQNKRPIGSTADNILHSLKISANVQHQEHSTPASPIPSATDSQVVIQSIDDFVIKGPIGYGSSAVVYSAVYTPTNYRVALKMIDLDMFERNQIDELRRETTLMALSKHPNVLRVLGSFVDGSKLYIVTPYLAGGSCLDIMKTNFREGLDELCIATILKQTLEALAYLHKNGHIHRDVKAGNLLMDEDGTVLLADFGVSSSLMDTGERGVRKTFVGTPCWMAPEVMEQAGYDYKADIWSFGITAIELATGHAPFAKLPPLKVLMMTLSSDPPTLVRETTKHKYSRIFKDMIDLCLNKDPAKRPTAEKLLQHQFFKQAKRREYLVKTLLADLPALEQRSHKKIPQRQISITKTDEWDFQDDDDNATSTPAAQEDIITKDKQQQQQPPQQPSVAQQQLQGGKRHISFGDVVVKNPPQPYAASVQAEVLAPTKKSRFVVEETSREQPLELIPSTGTTNSIGGTPISRQASIVSECNSPMLAPVDPDVGAEGVKKGRFSVNKQGDTSNQATVDSSTTTSSDRSITKSTSHDNITGIDRGASTDRKSRFEIHHGDQATTSSVSSAASPQLSAVTALNNLSLSRDNSLSSTNGHALTRDGSSHSRLPTRYQQQPLSDTNITTTTAPAAAAAVAKDDHSRKVGRFELSSESGRPSITSNNSNHEKDVLHPYEYSSSSSTSPSSSLSRGQLLRVGSDQMTPTFQTHMDELLKVNETQRNLLKELSGILKSTTASSSSSSSLLSSSSFLKKSASTTDTTQLESGMINPENISFRTNTSSVDELLSTVDLLENQLQISIRENQCLQRENEAFRKEIEILRNNNKNNTNNNKL